MRMVWSWMGASLCLLFFVTQASAQPAPAIVTPDTATLRAIETQVAQIRGLTPLEDPELRLLDHTTLSSYLADEYARDYPPNERESDQKVLVALGLIQPTDDLVQI